MRNGLFFVIGFALAIAAISTPIAVSDSVAAYVSQKIYDCAVRLDNQNGVIVKNVHIGSHKIGVCVTGTLENSLIDGVYP